MSPRRAPGESREAILTSARRLFGDVGYQGATIRRIARDAGVDPALVIQYFGSKDDLLAACLELPVPIEAVFAGVAHERDPGTVLVSRALAFWDLPEVRDRLLSLFRTAMSHDAAAEALARLLSTAVLPLVQELASNDDTELRAALVGSQVAGLVLTRLVLRLPALADAPVDELARAVGPTVTRYLRGDLG